MIDVPEGRQRSGLAHQLRVDIYIAIQRVPAWVRRMFVDKNDARAREAREVLVEHVATSLEQRFTITWLGSDDASQNAQPVKTFGPLCGNISTLQDEGQS